MIGDWYSYATLLIGDSGYVGEEEEEEEEEERFIYSG